MASVEDDIDLDFAEDDDLLTDDLQTAQNEPAAVSVPTKLSKPTAEEKKEPEERFRKSRREHPRIRYRSPLTSESDDSSRSVSPPPYRGAHALSARSTFQKHEKRLAHARRFGIDPPEETIDIGEDEVEELYRSMDVRADSTRYRLHSVYVRGVDGLSTFQIEKMFAEFDPTAVEMIDDMMLEMTKPLKRIRGGRQVEEGEVADSDDEEEDGEMRYEEGDDVTISIAKGSSESKSDEANVIEVDVDQVEIPPGKWRVITKHVGHNRLIILRFSLREDIAKGRVGLPSIRQKNASSSVDPDGYSYKWMNRRNRVRPGLNIFDEKGNELEWDYEHDTRFYEEPGEAPEENQEEGSTPVNESVAEVDSRKRKIKTRGRGAKRFKTVDELMSGSGSLAADREHLSRVKGSNANVESGNEDSDTNESGLSDDRDPSPTPQPWDPKRTNVHLRIATENRKARKK